MLKFILGVLVGAIIGFVISAMFSKAGNDDRKETGDNYAGNK